MIQANRVREVIELNSPRQSPFFLYDQDRLEKNIQEIEGYFQKLFARELPFSFSLKTNPNFKIIQLFKSRNYSLDVASLAELNYALELGFSPEKIFLGGVGVNDSAITMALQKRIGGIHFDSAEALIAAQANGTTLFSVRLQLGEAIGNKIGLTQNEIDALPSKIKLDGLHIYLGREAYTEKAMYDICEQVKILFANKKRFNENPTLFLGPGLPSGSLFDSLKGHATLNLMKSFTFNIKLEMGRALVSTAGFYGAPILAVKTTDQNQKVVIIDGGLQHLGSPWVTLKGGPLSLTPQFYSNQFGWLEVDKSDSAMVFGSLCLWHDCLHPRISIPKGVKRGDWIIVPHQGAYGLTAGVPLFIGENLPREYFLSNNQVIDVTHKKFKTYIDQFKEIS